MTDRGAGDSRPVTGAEYVYRALVDAGVDLLVGLPGTQTLPLDRVAAERDGMRYLVVRHETAVPHVAWGHYEAGGGMAATVTVPGPGDAAAVHGLANAREDCVPMIHVSPQASPEEVGKGPIHEFDSAAFDPAVKANLDAERPRDIPETVARGVEAALTPPYGPVRLGIPSSFLAGPLPDDVADSAAGPSDVDDGSDRSRSGPSLPSVDSAAIDRAAEILAAAERPVVLAGGGVRRSPGGPAAVAELVRRLNAPAIATYKGKGTVPEDSPHFLGVAGSHLPAGARRVLERADAVLALGSDLDGVSTDEWTLPLGERLVHVTLDPDDLEGGYEPDVPIAADVVDAVEGVLAALDDEDRGGAPDAGGGWDGARIATAVREEYRTAVRSGNGGAPSDGTIRTPAALSTLREALPTETVVTVDVGGFRLWTMQWFEATDPERFVATGSWAGMGVGVPAAIGAAVARPDRPVACLIGDGGFMMCLEELHTAAEADLDVVVIVFDNGDYGIISKSASLEGHPFAWDSPDFAAIAAGFGCSAERIDDRTALRGATERALDADGPSVIVVPTPRDEPSAVEAADYESAIDLP